MKNTTLCYLEQEGCLLMLHRIKKVNDENHDKWIGVGGKLEDKESPEDCVIREVREETGLELERWRYRGLVTFVSDLWETEYMHLYTADRFSGTLKECDEGVLEWVPRDRVESLPLWQGDKIFLRMIADPQTPFFSLKLEYRGEELVRAALDGRPLELN
jgi:8-oxo-dGTP diphosphatase